MMKTIGMGLLVIGGSILVGLFAVHYPWLFFATICIIAGNDLLKHG